MVGVSDREGSNTTWLNTGTSLYMKCVVAPWLVPTKFMVADIFTKMLDRDAFFLCRSYLMNLDNAPSQMVPGRFATMTRQWTRLLWSP